MFGTRLSIFFSGGDFLFECWNVFGFNGFFFNNNGKGTIWENLGIWASKSEKMSEFTWNLLMLPDFCTVPKISVQFLCMGNCFFPTSDATWIPTCRIMRHDHHHARWRSDPCPLWEIIEVSHSETRKSFSRFWCPILPQTCIHNEREQVCYQSPPVYSSRSKKWKPHKT